MAPGVLDGLGPAFITNILCMNILVTKMLNETVNVIIRTFTIYSETCLKQLLKNRQYKGLKAMRYLNAGQKYCRMLHGSIMQYF